MKRISLLTITVLLSIFMTAGLAGAWDLCYKDVNYTPQLQVTIESSIIRGQAVLAGSPYFPAPLTGYLAGGVAYFAIAYREDAGHRFYVINASNGAGSTWGILNDTSEYYDTPHSTQLRPCTAVEAEYAVESGANE